LGKCPRCRIIAPRVAELRFRQMAVLRRQSPIPQSLIARASFRSGSEPRSYGEFSPLTERGKVCAPTVRRKRRSGRKLFWWRTGYNWKTETQPTLKVTGRRLDGMAPPLQASDASNGYREQDWKSFMVVGIDIPTPGCWEITGHYEGRELSFVVWVTAARPPAPHTPC